jgi:hypothetical protein
MELLFGLVINQNFWKKSSILIQKFELRVYYLAGIMLIYCPHEKKKEFPTIGNR